ncbi:MAG TPA: magnesium-translocating P-type ATPase [Gemmatimonadaceae bacterium]|nr:magnesium-translocating P-type ATPase [Gemmatimonadaceae bacterium]
METVPPERDAGPDAVQGLTSDEAERRLADVGPNDPLAVARQSSLREIAEPFANPLLITLLLASGISAYVGEITSASIIVLMVLLSVALHLTQTYRSRRAVDRLRGSVAPTATVERDGAWRELPRRALVPGDVIRLTAGDLVPADARLVEARDLHVQQAALTGEALPVEKSAAPVTGGGDAADAHVVFLGTSIVSGTARAVITATGRATKYGDIAAHLAARAPQTEFERGMRAFSVFITRVVVFLVLFLLLVSFALHRDPLQSMLFAVALAVGLVPEFLPMITSVTLANGAVRMAGQHVIVKHLQAIQNLGSIDILCSDKTGTLTSGVMRVTRVIPAGRGGEARVFALASLNSRFETGIRSPLDVAILQEPAAEVAGAAKLDEIPFDFERRLSSIVVARDGERRLISKGAPESVLERCATYDDGGTSAPLDATARARLLAAFHEASQRGERLLGVASRIVPRRGAYSVADETDLTFAGLIAFSDPPLADAAETLAALRGDGVDVKILTGDNELVAAHVCAEAGLATAGIVTGADIDPLSIVALGALADRTTVFARVSPVQKNRILLALKARGHVVGFLGDGINDAPALHTADVGISVASAVDVARDAAQVVLLERNLRVLHKGILEGRTAFGNVLKYLLMGTSSNFGNMFSMAVAALVLPFLPMLPPQILLNNFLYDAAQITIPTDHVDDVLIRVPRRWDMRLVRRFMVAVGPVSSIFDFVTFWVLLEVFHATEPAFHTGWFVESLVTQTLVLLVIRTTGNPLRSHASRPLTWSIIGAVALGTSLPFLPIAVSLGLTPLPARFFLVLVPLTIAYLLLVQVVKARVVGRWLAQDDAARPRTPAMPVPEPVNAQ